ncbi:hypothetical protein C823_001013 [Eubacterium plexicaudatum ASF492]|nr:hypothetical protein C823_001013 [Eubacterium plexicaudatum ASF492]
MTDTISKARKIKDTILKLMMVLSAGLICSLLLGLIGYILYRGIPHISWMLVSTKPSLLRGTVGILPNILNTLYIIIITLVIVLPLGVGTAIYLNEYAKNKNWYGSLNWQQKPLPESHQLYMDWWECSCLCSFSLWEPV